MSGKSVYDFHFTTRVSKKKIALFSFPLSLALGLNSLFFLILSFAD